MAGMSEVEKSVTAWCPRCLSAALFSSAFTSPSHRFNRPTLPHAPPLAPLSSTPPPAVRLIDGWTRWRGLHCFSIFFLISIRSKAVGGSWRASHSHSPSPKLIFFLSPLHYVSSFLHYSLSFPSKPQRGRQREKIRCWTSTHLQEREEKMSEGWQTDIIKWKGVSCEMFGCIYPAHLIVWRMVHPIYFSVYILFTF